VGGRIIELPVTENAKVSKGDLLFRIDPVPYRLAVEQAEADSGVAVGTIDTATHALEAREGRFAELLRLLMSFPGRLEFAVRLALICALTTLVVEIYQTPDPTLTAYFVFVLNKPDRGTSLILSIAMLALFSLIVRASFLLR